MSSYIRNKMIFEAMGNFVRREVIAQLLVTSDLAAADLAVQFDMTISGMMWHLKVLEDVGLITRHKIHNRNICSLNRKNLDEVSEWVETMSLDY